MKLHAAWLRGINAGKTGHGRKSVPMAELRELASDLGWDPVRTYIQSGNLAFGASGRPSSLERALEAAIEERFGFEVPVAVRTAADLRKARANCPFDHESVERAHLVHVGFANAKLTRDVLTALEPYCERGERVALQGSFLWADYASGVARSKLTPAALDRAVGASVTMRNLKTLDAVCALFDALEG
ncbi:MAG: DUF1697 domain-containing protein [Planctomycetota bacterium]